MDASLQGGKEAFRRPAEASIQVDVKPASKRIRHQHPSTREASIQALLDNAGQYFMRPALRTKPKQAKIPL